MGGMGVRAFGSVEETAGATVADSRTDMAAFMRSERDKYASIVKFANIQE